MKRLTPREQILLWKVGRAIHGNVRQPSFRYIALDNNGAIRLGKQYEGQTEPEILPDEQLAALFDSYTDDMRRLLEIIRRRTNVDVLPAQYAGLALRLNAIVNGTAPEAPF